VTSFLWGALPAYLRSPKVSPTCLYNIPTRWYTLAASALDCQNAFFEESLDHNMKDHILKFRYLYLLILFFNVSNIIWFWKDDAPPPWDQSYYLWNSELLFHALHDKGLLSFLSAYMTILGGTRAPLIAVLPLPFYFVLGDSYGVALGINLVFLVIGSIYLYRLGEMVSGRACGVLSVFILNTFPLLAGLSREFLVDYGLTVFVIAWIYYLLRLDETNSRKDAYALGVILGLGMLMKISFFLYIAAPTIFITAYRLYRHKSLPERWTRHGVVIATIGTIIAGPWYFRNIRRIVGFAAWAGYGEAAKNWGMGDVFSINTILAYWTSLINYGVSFYYFLLLLVAAFLVCLRLARRGSHHILPKVDRTSIYTLLLWVVVPLVILTFGTNKDYRYVAPTLPALAILMSISLVRLSSRKAGFPMLFFLVVFPLFNYLFISFSSKPISYGFRPFILLQDHLGFAHPPRKEVWPNLELIKHIDDDNALRGTKKSLTTLLVDHPYMNWFTSSYYAELTRSEARFETVHFWTAETMDQILDRIRKKSDYLVTKSETLGPDFSNTKNVLVQAVAERGALPFAQIGTLPLPDGTSLRIYRKNLKP
jgi:hypothetical protein